MLPLGFRHAATLLLTQQVRAIPNNATPDEVGRALRRLADDLAALADDMRMPPEAGAWLGGEYLLTIARLLHPFDAAPAKAYATDVFAKVGTGRRDDEGRDLFIVYVPEDRLPIAAPLAIAITKRRLSVAFSDFEVATPQELVAAIANGLARHGVGIVLGTAALDRAGLRAHVVEGRRLRVLTAHQTLNIDELVRWCRAM